MNHITAERNKKYILEGRGCRGHVIYQATIYTENSLKIYISLSSNQLKNEQHHTISQLIAN